MPIENVKVIDIGYKPRKAFEPYHARTQRWSCMVVHRRAGKTVASIADLVDYALRTNKKDARYAYVAPTYTQAKDVAWGYLKNFTREIPTIEQRESDLAVIVHSKNARIKLYGAENYDRLRGLYLDGVVIDEVAQIDPRAWSEVIRPALSDREGWATFIGTPNGRDAFYELYNKSLNNPEWYSMLLPSHVSNIIPEAELADARQSMTEDQFSREYGCSFDVAAHGAYYSKEILHAETEKRVGVVPWDRAYDVVTGWDLGMRDSTAVWFAQFIGREIRLIDYYENSGLALDHYVGIVRGKPYVYANHFLPHDAAAKELGTGKTRQEVMENLGIWTSVVKRHRIEDGINAVRMAFNRLWFDKDKCGKALEKLRLYRAIWDERNKTLSREPLHDQNSHAADAMRYLIMGKDERPKVSRTNRENRTWVI